MSQKLFFWFLFYVLKYCQTLLSDDSFYFYDDGSLNPFSKLEQDLEDSSNSNFLDKNFKPDSELNENLNLYKDLAQQLRKSLDSFQIEKYKGLVGTSNDKDNYSNIISPQNKKILKKEAKNLKNILVSEMQSNAEMENNDVQNIPFDNSIPIQTIEQPSLLQRIKDKFDNVFHRATIASEFVRSDVTDSTKENNTQPIRSKFQKNNYETNDNKLKDAIVKSRSINEIFDKRTMKQKHDNQNSFTFEEVKVLKNFVKFVKENKNGFTDSEIETTSGNKTLKHHNIGSTKPLETTAHTEHSNKKQDHHNSIKHHKNTTAKVSTGDSVKLNISVTELDEDVNKKNEEGIGSKHPKEKTKDKINDIKQKAEGCPFNFDNMDIEMEFKEEENNGIEKFSDCKPNVKDMKTKINLNSRLNPKDNIKEITEDYNKIDSKLYKRLQSDISENVNNLKNMKVLDFQIDENLGIEEDRPLRQYQELMSSEIDHPFISGPKPLNVNFNQSPSIDNTKNKDIYDPKPNINSNRTNHQYEKQPSKDNILSDVSFNELQRFKELIEKRLRRIESENKYNEILKGNLSSLTMIEKNLQNNQGQYGMNRFRKKNVKREKNRFRKQDKVSNFYIQQDENEKYKREE